MENSASNSASNSTSTSGHPIDILGYQYLYKQPGTYEILQLTKEGPNIAKNLYLSVEKSMYC